MLATVCAAAHAIEDRADAEPNKPVAPGQTIVRNLTPSLYRETAARSAFDLNLRGNREQDTFRAGQYRRGSEFQQTRAGYERQFGLTLGGYCSA